MRIINIGWVRDHHVYVMICYCGNRFNSKPFVVEAQCDNCCRLKDMVELRASYIEWLQDKIDESLNLD